MSGGGEMINRWHKLEFRPVQGAMKINPGHKSRATSEHTVVHEWGHHEEYEQAPITFLRHAGDITPAEGYAEGFAYKHRVARRNEPPASYADVAAYKNLRHRPLFQQHFEKASGTTVSAALGEHEHLGPQFQQGSLFHGPSPQGQRYVKTWSTPAHVGTIKVGGV